ncbi:MAG: hypothetical protein ISR65_20580 [Bacteriovoracaceae bacterium]|nr:hypothetical protein [Bacteriovoracaceae bacterium]
MKKFIASTLVSVSLLVTSGICFANRTIYAPNVKIKFSADGSGKASGSLLAARMSTDRFEFIGCHIMGGRQAGVSCTARKGSMRNSARCSAAYPGLAVAAGAMTAFSVIEFTFGKKDRNGNRACKSLIVKNNSTQIQLPTDF